MQTISAKNLFKDGMMAICETAQYELRNTLSFIASLFQKILISAYTVIPLLPAILKQQP